MKSVTIEISVPFIPFLEEALKLKKAHPSQYQGTAAIGLVQLAQRISAMNQDEAFNRAMDRVNYDLENINIHTEPNRVSADEYEAIYHATYSMASEEQLTLFIEKHNLADEAIKL